MEFAYIIIVCLALTVVLALGVLAWRRRQMAGSGAFLLQMACVVVWLLGELFLLMARSDGAVIFWWKFEQIGIFSTCVACVHFAVEYGRFTAYRKLLPYLWILPALAVALIFTDPIHHIIGFNFVVNHDVFFGKTIGVTSSPLGQLLVAYNFCMVLLAMVFLGVFASKLAKGVRLQVYYFMLAILLVLAFSLIKPIFLESFGVNIPEVVLILPGSLLLFYNLFRHSLFQASPIARDKVFDVIEQGIVVADSFGTIVDRNPFAKHLFGMFFGVKGELAGKRMKDVFGAYPKWVSLVESNSAGDMELEFRDDRPHYFRIRVYPLQADRGASIGTVTIIRDITARRLQEFELKNKAEMDGLTGLLNRAGFLNSFARLLADAAETGELVSVLMMDLDKFKRINDTFGHICGDRVLMLFAEMVRGVLRQKDVVARIGGDEFAAVLPGVGRAEALAVAERIRTKAEERVIEMEGGNCIRFTLSIGVCDSEDASLSAEELLKCADGAMYQAKNKTRNCCVVWE